MPTSLDPTARALLEANLALAEDRDVHTVLERVVGSVRRLLDAEYVGLGITADEAALRIIDLVEAGRSPGDVIEEGTPTGPLARPLIERTAIRLHDVALTSDPIGPRAPTFLGLPVQRSDRLRGVLYVIGGVGQSLHTDRDVEVAEAFAAQAAIAIDNARLYDAVDQRASMSAALVRAVGAVASERDPEEVLDTIVEVARKLVDAEFAALGVLGEDGVLDPFIHVGMDPAVVQRIGDPPVGEGVLRAVTVEGRPVRLEDLTEHPASVGFPEHHPPMTSFLGVPLRIAGEVLGNLYLTNKRSGSEFTDADEELVTALAGQAAVALDRARADARVQGTVAQLRSLLRANLALTGELDPDRVLQTIVDLSRELVDAEYAALGVLDQDGEALEAFIHSGIDAETVGRIGPLPEGRGVLGAVIVGKRPIRLRDLADHPASVGFPGHHPPMSSFLGVPLAYHGKVLGNLYLTNKRGGEFTAEDEDLVSALAAQAAVAIENARVYAHERDLVERLREVGQMKTEFVSLVSHELRTPLVALRSGAELLAGSMEHLDPVEAGEVLAAIVRQSTRLQLLIDNLLDLSRIDQGRLKVSMSVLPLRAFVGATLESLPQLQDWDVRMEIPDELDVRADEFYLGQVLTNLLVNATNYGAPPLVLSARVEDDAVVLEVRDHGPGLDPIVEQQLFDRFVRGPQTGDAVPGSGLGLALVQAYVESFGGRVWYESGDPEGACFCVALPLPQSEPELEEDL